MQSMQDAVQFLQDAAYNGELDISLGNNRLHVEFVKFDEDEPMFICEPGTVAQGNICRRYFMFYWFILFYNKNVLSLYKNKRYKLNSTYFHLKLKLLNSV